MKKVYTNIRSWLALSVLVNLVLGFLLPIALYSNKPEINGTIDAAWKAARTNCSKSKSVPAPSDCNKLAIRNVSYFPPSGMDTGQWIIEFELYNSQSAPVWECSYGQTGNRPATDCIEGKF